MTKHFTATGYLPSGKLTNCAGDIIDFASLPAFLRVLLTTDGTVTKSLESWFWEPVAVRNLGQAYIQLQEPAPIIACAAGESVLQRRVELVGQRSERHFVLADSLIRAAILPSGVREDLEAGLVGIGEILRECNLETYREIVDFGYQQPASRLLKNVGEAASARQKLAKKRSLQVVNEHFEPIFNAAMATQVVSQQPAQGATLWRTYRIVMGGEPFIQITEYFPIEIYR